MATDRQKVSYFVRLRKQREISLFNAFKKLYARQGKEVSEQYIENGLDGALSVVNRSDLFVQDLMKRFYSEVIGTLGLAQLKSMIRQQRKEEFPDPSRFVMLSQEWIAMNVLKQSDLITGTSRKIVEKIILQGVSDGKGEKVIAKNIKDAFKGEIATYRARTIARTETGIASSYAQDLGAKESGLDFTKIWTPVGDDATRDGHMGVLPVGMNQNFIVNGESLEYPNDPRGSAKNTINCRCVCRYDPILD